MYAGRSSFLMNIEGWQEKYNSFLPAGWSLRTSRRGLYTDWERRVVFLPDDFDFMDVNVLGLLHEVAHACLDTQRTDEDLQYECWLRDKASMGFFPLSELEKAEYRRVVIEEELRAWGYVLEYFEKVKQLGLLSIDVDIDLVRGLAESKMNTYWKMIES